jgi:hypothetical protein
VALDPVSVVADTLELPQQKGTKMTKYLLTVTHRFELETDSIREVLDNYEFPVFDIGVIGEAEFLDGTDTYEVVEPDAV